MTYLKKIFIFVFCSLLLSSCATDNAVSHSIIQKRKYTHGYHIWSSHKTPLKKSETKEDALVELPTSPIKLPDLHTPEPVLHTYTKDPVIIRSEQPEQAEAMEVLTISPFEKTTALKAVDPVHLITLNSPPQDSVLSLPPQKSPYAVISAMMGSLGIIALVLGGFGIAILAGLLAIAFAKVGMVQIKGSDGKYDGKGVATLGYVLGSIPIVLMILFIVLLIILF